MRLCYIVSGIILILPITDLAVAVPVVIQEKPPRTGVDVVHIPEDTTTIFEKRGGELEKLLEDTESLFTSKPEEPLATQPSALADRPTDAEQPQLSNPEEQSQVSDPQRAPLSAEDKMTKLWRKLVMGHSFTGPEQSSVTHVPEGPSLVSSSDRASVSADDQMREVWRAIVGYPKGHSFTMPEQSSATYPWSGSRPADGSMTKKPLLPVLEGPSLAFNPDRAPVRADDTTMKTRFEVIGYPKSHAFAKPVMLSATQLSSILQPWGHAGGSVPVKKLRLSIPEEPSQVSGSHRAPSSVGHQLNNMRLNLADQPEDHFWQKQRLSVTYPSQALSSKGSESTVSDYQMGSVQPPPGPGSPSTIKSDDVSTNPDPQWMGAVSSGKRKRP